MVREVPVLIPEAAIEEARTRFDPNHRQQSPLLDEQNVSMQRFTLQTFDASQPWTEARRGTRNEPRVIDANDPDSVLQDARRDMAVLASDGIRVGLVERIGVDGYGRRDSVVVVYGRLTKRRKMIEGRLVDLVDDGVVMLSIDAPAFKALPDA